MTDSAVAPDRSQIDRRIVDHFLHDEEGPGPLWALRVGQRRGDRRVRPGRRRPNGVMLGERTLRIVVGALGVFHLLEGAWMFFAPGSFFDTIGR